MAFHLLYHEKASAFGLAAALAFIFISSPQTASAASALTHSSTNLGSKYGDWGTNFTCLTCHSPTAPNIKRIVTSIPSTIGAPVTKPVVFKRLSGLGNDGDLHTSSNRICEVCHTRTTVHRYNTTGQIDFNHMGANGLDCITCHRHKDAFAASCNVCHGYPPTVSTLGENGLAQPATGILPAGQSGAHAIHVADNGMTCETCHNGYTASPMGNNKLEIGFRLAGDTVSGFGSVVNGGSFSGKTPAAPYTGIASSSAGTTVSTSGSGTNSCAVYCHGAWATSSGGLTTTPAWSGSLGGAGCNACHGASATTPPSQTFITGAHPRHAGNATGGLAKSCASCHGDVSDPRHLDGQVRWDFTGLGIQATYAPPANTAANSGKTAGAARTGAYGTCSNIYCHSTVQSSTDGINGSITYKSVQWGGPALTCSGCHTDMASSNGSGSHPLHVYSIGFSCGTCHTGAGQQSIQHANGNIEVVFSGTAVGGYYSQAFNPPGNGYGICSNIYCHSDGRSFTTPFTQATPASWGAGPLACNSCHTGGLGGSTQGPTYSGGKANSHPKHRFTCEKCHASVTNGTGVIVTTALHGNKSYNLLAGGNATFTIAVQGTPTVPTQCSNISCHGNGNATWGQVLSCGSCHANMATFAGSGSHPKHASNYPLDCSICHGAEYSSTLVTSQNHGNNQVNISFTGTGSGTVYSKGGIFSTGGIYGSCSSSYCHSEGKSFAPPFTQIAPITWGSGTSCYSCHNGAPIYVGGKANSHPKHPFTCDKCHSNVYNGGSGAIINQSLHANQVYNLQAGGNSTFTVAVQGTPTVPTQCSNISCHGGNSATWGGAALACGNCHAGTIDRDNFLFGDNVTAVINSTEWQTKGHGLSIGANFGTVTTLAACQYCHDGSVTHGAAGNFFRLANLTNPTWGKNGVCLVCHAQGSSGFNGKNATKKISSYHYGGKHSGTAGGRWCWDCHDPHGDSNIKMIGATVAKTSADDGMPITQVTATFTANASGTDFAGGAPSTRICNTCHTSTLHYTASSSDGHQSTTRCTQCHSHSASDANAAFGADCLGCHSTQQGKRAPAVAHLKGNSHHVQGVTLTSAHCYQCHWEANSNGSINSTYHAGVPDGVVNLVVFTATTRPTSYTVNSTSIEYTANGTRAQLAKINSHCMGCHSDTGKSMALPGPFGDGKLPHVYSWDGVSIATKYKDLGSTPWGKYNGTNVTPKNTVIKAFSAHGNATTNAGGWNTSETWPNTRGGTTVDRNVYCIDCHNSHGSSVNGTTVSYVVTGAVNGGLLKDVSSGQGGSTATYKPTAGGSAANKNAFNAGAALCFDCHQTQTTSGTRPWGWSSTYGATAAILGYMDTPSFGPGTFPNSTRYPYKVTTHRGGHFGASSALGTGAAHPINGLCTPCHDPHGVNPAAANRNYMVPMLKGTWLTSIYKEDATPTENVAYRGQKENPGPLPSASYNAAINSYRIDQNTLGLTTKINETDTQFAGLCLKCHTKPSLTNGTNHAWKSKDRIHEAVKGWKTANANAKHGYACAKCHAPHNSQLPRLMITNCLDARHRGRVGNQANPVRSGSYSDEKGSGSGKMPGKYSYSSSEKGSANNSLWGGTSCHDSYDSQQYWNNVTPWTQ